MKNQALFSSKDKSEQLKCRLLQFLFDTLRVKPPQKMLVHMETIALYMDNKRK